MSLTGQQLWQRYCEYVVIDKDLGFELDISRVQFKPSLLNLMAPAMTRAFEAMEKLEAGAIANRDERRMVGHYWLRDVSRVPAHQHALVKEITDTNLRLKTFAQQIHSGAIQGEGGHFENVLHIGIGGSALGPQFLADGLGSSSDKLRMFFLDNTDPDGIDRVLDQIGDELDKTLVTVASKSGGTPETRNGMIEARLAYERRGLSFAKHAVAITQLNSKLDQQAASKGWLERFPLWDWVGGRTSITSVVGLLPAALQGIDIDALLDGAAAMDRLTRVADTRKNPAALLALMWYHCTGGRGAKDMVILPYKDRLSLFSRYLQQLVMESLGKELTRDDCVVRQGIAVYGNKGSTDQHAYVQQLREGVPNFFATFIQVLKDRDRPSAAVEAGVTAGDYLNGFWQGTRSALYESDIDLITLTLDEVSPRTCGALIALYERTVGLYAELINVNAYHQPGVEAGKKAAQTVLELQKAIVAKLSLFPGPATAEQIASELGQSENVESVYHILRHMAANVDHRIRRGVGAGPMTDTFQSI